MYLPKIQRAETLDKLNKLIQQALAEANELEDDIDIVCDVQEFADKIRQICETAGREAAQDEADHEASPPYSLLYKYVGRVTVNARLCTYDEASDSYSVVAAENDFYGSDRAKRWGRDKALELGGVMLEARQACGPQYASIDFDSVPELAA